ncbi:craniofacial development protein 2-like [Montipora foliosa]|uniref:craniofacial development protein 2-like n=1 Tax=Montipora foliosa TaxID=591990 RepID=UPI0035F15A45
MTPLSLERSVPDIWLPLQAGEMKHKHPMQGGVGLLLAGQKARKALLKAKRISKRIMTAEFNGNPQTTVIVVYAPTNCADEVEVEGFYNDTSNTLQDVPAHNFLACIGDFNARLGPDVVPFTYHVVTNRNGKYLVESVLSEHSLIVANIWFQKRPGKLWTFTSRIGSLRQLDYILVRRKWRNSVQDVEAYNTFSTMGSDHRVVCAKIKFSLRVSKVAKMKYECMEEVFH